MRIDDNDQNETTADGASEPAGELSHALAGGGDDAEMVVAEEKKTVSRGTLVMFAVLIAGGAGLFIMHRQAGPSAASAAVNQETVEANKTISTFLSGGDASIKSMETLLRNTERVVQQFLAYPSMTQVPLSELQTNPFRQRAQAQASGDEGLSAAAEKKRREEQRQAILKAVQGLALQSIMCSDTRKACMINNTLYLEGQQIEEFTIEKISLSSVVVKNGPYRFELRMQR